MPILEFALDATALYRVQVHLNTHQGPVSVMLNHSALGSLTTLEEQVVGKNFRLPDSSVLRVQILNGHPQAWCNGFPLAVTSVPEALPVTNTQPRSSMGRGVTALLILNVLLIGILSVWFFAAALLNMSSREFFLPFLLTGLLSLVELIGIFALCAWKKWGLYLALCSMLANFILAIVFSIIDYRTFLPLAGLTLLYLVLRSSGIWHKLG